MDIFLYATAFAFQTPFEEMVRSEFFNDTAEKFQHFFGDVLSLGNLAFTTTLPPFVKNESLELIAQQICGATNTLRDPVVRDFQFWGTGVTICCVGIVGLVGNILSLITIGTMTKRSLFNKLLITLSIFDSLFIITSGLFNAQQSFNFNNEVYNFLFPKFIYPLAGISMIGSIYTCLAIALERYLGIYCHSQKTSDHLDKRSKFYFVAIITLSALIEFPKFFEVQATANDRVPFVYTALRENKLYIRIYTLWFRLFATAAIPFVLMVFFNSRILTFYRKHR